MWIPAGIVYIIAGLAFFAGWLRESERRVQLREARARGLQPGANSCAFVFLFLVLVMTGCDKDSVAQDAHALTGGDARKGAIAIRDHGCASCHTIPGIHGADSQVGPPLTGISQRTYLAGILQNTPESLVRWIQNPPKVDEQTAMPDMHLSESDARDIASYLYTLR